MATTKKTSEPLMSAGAHCEICPPGTGHNLPVDYPALRQGTREHVRALSELGLTEKQIRLRAEDALLRQRPGADSETTPPDRRCCVSPAPPVMGDESEQKEGK